MIRPHIDADVLIRFLTGDDLRKQAAAAALLTKVERGSLTITAPDTVIADAVFVLNSARLYNKPRPDVAALLIPLVRLPHFQVRNRPMLLRALELFGTTTTLDFGDCCIVAAMEEEQAIMLYSFDRDFDSVPGITRQEP